MQAAHTALKNDVVLSELRQQRAIEMAEKRGLDAFGTLCALVADAKAEAKADAVAAERRQQAAEGRLLDAFATMSADTKADAVAAERRQQDALMAAEGRQQASEKRVLDAVATLSAEVKANTAQQQQWVTAGTAGAVILSALLAVTSAVVVPFWPRIKHALAVALQRAL